ncbi:MAG: thiocillin family RiPP [Nonomuraea sp.]|nr:thiocillin family RiPP [Nonomuraea sp.]
MSLDLYAYDELPDLEELPPGHSFACAGTASTLACPFTSVGSASSLSCPW